jgi:hypothetical protein
LNVKIDNIRRKRWSERQVEVAQNMVAMIKFTISYSPLVDDDIRVFSKMTSRQKR